MSTTELTPTNPETVALQTPLEKARAYAQESHAQNTRRAYKSDWADFESWCQEQGRSALPATGETVALYLSDRADICKVVTLERRLVALSQAHQAVHFESPTGSVEVRVVLQGIRRTHEMKQEQKKPLWLTEVRAISEALPESLLGVRDRALLLLGFAGAFRRSELVALDVADLAFVTEGLAVTIRRSKTDQEGRGYKVGIPYGGRPHTCPIRAVQAWLAEAGITEGPVFRAVNRHGVVQPSRLTGKSVGKIVKRWVGSLGLDADAYAGHSLRAGFITSAAKAGVAECDIMRQSRHKSLTVFRGYIRDDSLWRTNAAAQLGL